MWVASYRIACWLSFGSNTPPPCFSQGAKHSTVQAAAILATGGAVHFGVPRITVSKSDGVEQVFHSLYCGWSCPFRRRAVADWKWNKGRWVRCNEALPAAAVVHAIPLPVLISGLSETPRVR
jgi:hypothetical protein